MGSWAQVLSRWTGTHGVGVWHPCSRQFFPRLGADGRVHRAPVFIPEAHVPRVVEGAVSCPLSTHPSSWMLRKVSLVGDALEGLLWQWV